MGLRIPSVICSSASPILTPAFPRLTQRTKAQSLPNWNAALALRDVVFLDVMAVRAVGHFKQLRGTSSDAPRSLQRRPEVGALHILDVAFQIEASLRKHGASVLGKFRRG